MRARRTIILLCLCVVMLVQTIGTPASASQPTDIYSEQIVKIALSSNDVFTRKYNEIILEQLKHQDAVRSVREKQRNMASFRWSPLLSFKFPERPNLSESMEFMFKPLTIETNIVKLNHEMGDLKYMVIGEVAQLFLDCYMAQEQVAFHEEMLAQARIDVERVRFMAMSDPDNEKEVERLDKRIATLTSAVAQQRRNFENAKKKLTSEVGMDLTTGYYFKNCMEEMDVNRVHLEGLVNHTLANSQALYDAKLLERVAYLNMTTAEQMMRNFYGNGYMNIINPFLAQVKRGYDVDTAAFQLSYRQFLTAIDARWQGSWRIIFFRFPKERLKGPLSGIRYVEDEPYYLFTASMEYQSAAREVASIEKSIRAEVENEFEGIITANNAYQAALKTVGETQVDVDRMRLLNLQGKVSGQEVNEKQEDYQQQQIDTLGLLGDYNELLISYDRLTCGGITRLLNGEQFDGATGAGGDLLASYTGTDTPYYYMENRIEDMKFVFGVSIPEDFEPDVTHYELWYNDTQIGARTAVKNTISHLKIAANNEDQIIEVRFYEDLVYTQTCKIDATEQRGPLDLRGATPPPQPAERTVGTFEAKTELNLGVVKITIKPSQREEIAGWRLLTSDGKVLFSDDIIGKDETLTYLHILADDINKVRIELYDKTDMLIYTGRFDTTSMGILVPTQGV